MNQKRKAGIGEFSHRLQKVGRTLLMIIVGIGAVVIVFVNSGLILESVGDWFGGPDNNGNGAGGGDDPGDDDRSDPVVSDPEDPPDPGEPEDLNPRGDFELTVTLVPESGARIPDDLRVDIVWFPPFGLEEMIPPETGLFRVKSADFTAQDFSYRYVFGNPPPDWSLQRFDHLGNDGSEAAEAAWAMAIICGFRDLDDNDTVSDEDEIVTISEQYVVTYAEGNIREALQKDAAQQGNDQPQFLRIKEGFHLNRVMSPRETGRRGAHDDICPIEPREVFLMIPASEDHDWDFPNFR